VIEARGLTKRHGTRTAVDGLTFEVASGRVTAFLGRNGAGKSTTMRMLVGLDRPTAGTARIAGRAYEELAEPMRTVGALLDSGAAHPGRTARDHLLWLAHSNRIGARRVDEVLDTVELSGAARRRVGGFSLGMRQRLGIAAALLGDPAVLLLDEPANGLDPEGIRWLRTVLRSLAREGRTVLVSSHLMGEVARTADHLLVIGRGRLLADTPLTSFVTAHGPQTLRVRTPRPQALLDLLDAEGIPTSRQPDGALHVSGAGEERIGRLAARHGIPLLELTPEEDPLEEAFLRLTSPAAGSSR
jgi:ABC-2 type transport system ATP-binding protein